MADKEGASTCSQAIVVCSYPDVCLAPDKPTPFQIIAFYSDAVNYSTNVNFATFAAATMKTRIPCVTGDESGVGGGIKSGINIGYCRPCKDYSSTIRVNGYYVLRHDAEFEMNCSGPEAIGNTKGKTVLLVGGPGTSVGANGQPEGDTDPPPQKEEIGFLGQVGGFFVGAGKAGWELVKFGGKTVQYVADIGGDLIGIGDLTDWAFDGDVPAWLPSSVRGQQTTQTISDIATAIWNDPALVWEGIKAPYVEAWAQGRYGEAIGRGTFEAITAIVGTKGVDKLGKLGSLASKLSKADDFADVFTVLKRADTVIPEEFASVTDELLQVGRTQNKLGELIDGARKAGTLDEVLDLGKFTPEELDELAKAGKLTPEEVARAKNAASASGKDGVTVHQVPREIPCFTGDTLVLTKDGLKPIRSLIYGDQIASYDENFVSEDGYDIDGIVSEVLRNKAIHLYKIHLDSETITSTGSHPFWVCGLNRWIEARFLTQGMCLITKNRVQLKIHGIEHFETNEIPTYNLSINPTHCFFVGEAKVLVHNSNIPRGKIYIGYVNGQPVYVGQTIQDLSTRQLQHWRDAVKFPDKYGFKEGMELKLVDGMDGLTQDQMNYHERRIYDELKEQGYDLKNRQIPYSDEKMAELKQKYCN